MKWSKLKYCFFATIVFIGCQQKQNNLKPNYVDVYKVLNRDSLFKKFIGLNIYSREPHYYEVYLSEPNIAFDLIYPNKVDREVRTELVDSLKKSSSINFKSTEEKADSIIALVQNVLSNMEKYSITNVNFFYENVPGKSTFIIKSKDEYFINFWLSRHEYLRYYHFPDTETKSYPNDVIEAKWLDSSWVYLKRQLVDDTLNVK